jgi:hypothetical protein
MTWPMPRIDAPAHESTLIKVGLRGADYLENGALLCCDGRGAGEATARVWLWGSRPVAWKARGGGISCGSIRSLASTTDAGEVDRTHPRRSCPIRPRGHQAPRRSRPESAPPTERRRLAGTVAFLVSYLLDGVGMPPFEMIERSGEVTRYATEPATLPSSNGLFTSSRSAKELTRRLTL